MYNFDSFQLIIKCSPENALEIAEILIKSRTNVPNGSSFAVTSDARDGFRNVHLSRVSYVTLKKAGFFEGAGNRYENVTAPGNNLNP